MSDTSRTKTKGNYKKPLTIADKSLEELEFDGDKLVTNERPLKTLYLWNTKPVLTISKKLVACERPREFWINHEVERLGRKTYSAPDSLTFLSGRVNG